MKRRKRLIRMWGCWREDILRRCEQLMRREADKFCRKLGEKAGRDIGGAKGKKSNEKSREDSDVEEIS